MKFKKRILKKKKKENCVLTMILDESLLLSNHKVSLKF